MKKMLLLIFCLLAVCGTCAAQGTAWDDDEAYLRFKKRAVISTGVTWTLIQHLKTVNCGNSNATCSISGVTTTAGDLLILVGTNDDSAQHIVFSSASGDSTWTHCPASGASENYSGSNWLASDCAYILSAAGGTGLTISWTWNLAAVAHAVELYEVRRSTGTATYDTGNVASASSCGSCTGPTLTLTGSSDFIAQWGSFENSIAPPGTSPWLNPNDSDNSNTDSAWVGALNQSSGAGPTYTQTGAGGGAMSAVAFK
jgi:hypothetical protein